MTTLLKRIGGRGDPLKFTCKFAKGIGNRALSEFWPPGGLQLQPKSKIRNPDRAAIKQTRRSKQTSNKQSYSQVFDLI
jgi:hypothetical protein